MKQFLIIICLLFLYSCTTIEVFERGKWNIDSHNIQSATKPLFYFYLRESRWPKSYNELRSTYCYSKDIVYGTYHTDEKTGKVVTCKINCDQCLTENIHYGYIKDIQLIGEQDGRLGISFNISGCKDKGLDNDSPYIIALDVPSETNTKFNIYFWNERWEVHDEKTKNKLYEKLGKCLY